MDMDFCRAVKSHQVEHLHLVPEIVKAAPEYPFVGCIEEDEQVRVHGYPEPVSPDIFADFFKYSCILFLPWEGAGRVRGKRHEI